MIRALSAQQNVLPKNQPRPIQSAVMHKRNIKKDEIVVQQIGLEKTVLNVIQNAKRLDSGISRAISSAKSSIFQDVLEIIPKEVTFKNIQYNQRYELYLSIRNLSSQPRRIRFQQPKTLLFQVDYDMQQAVAAGLAVKILVSFLSHEPINNDCHDSITVMSDDFRQEIQLHACRSSATFTFEKSLDFGYIQTGSEVRKTLKFKNDGVGRGKINIKSAQQNQMRIEPNIFTLDQDQQTFVEVYLKPKDIGIFRGTLVVSGGEDVPDTKIDISATCVDYTRLFVDESGCQCSLIDFGESYMGNQKIFHGTYINNTPKSFNFNIITRKGIQNNQDEQLNLYTPNELGVEQSERIIHVEPNKGQIKAYSNHQFRSKVKCWYDRF